VNSKPKEGCSLGVESGMAHIIKNSADIYRKLVSGLPFHQFEKKTFLP
jgi:hypothetical protein